MKTLDDIKKEAIFERVIFFEGHQHRAAESLDISQRGLRYILSRIKQDDPELFSTLPKYKYVKPHLKDDFAEKWEAENKLNEIE
jgi:hypothetical protein